LKRDGFVRLILPRNCRAEFPQQIRRWRKRDLNLRFLLAKKPLALRWRVAERSDGQSQKARSPIGGRGVVSLFFHQRVMVRIPFAQSAAAQRTAPGWGRTGRLLIRSAWGKSGAVGERGRFPRETVVLSASQATIDGREPSKVGSETTQIHRWRSALAETLPCLGGSVR